MLLHNCLVFNSDSELIEGSAGSLLHYRIRVPKKETRTQRLNRIRESEELRCRLYEHVRQRSETYCSEAVLMQWISFLAELEPPRRRRRRMT